jgi:putative transposase
MGTDDPLISPHELYLRPGSDPESRRLHYRNLFQARMPEATIGEIREPANKARFGGMRGFADNRDSS